ncbi:MAG: hypothetical protein KBF21_11280 [Thermoanaerobaculia bacterium]|jgi:hypothetical protein|nr:hypothetical protein [Thermoanaerobaculia bacterium]MBP9824795.1 hypothetical protein [Thermoanaerobaculia bacterium]
MHSDVAASLRAERRRAEQELSPLARLALAQQLGREAVAAFSLVHGVTAEEARKEFARRKQRGRRPSRCAAGG